MDIAETDNYYVVTFFPNAEETEIDDKIDEKGYKAIIGLQDGEYIVMKVMYDKNIYPYDEEDRIERFGAGYKKDTVKSLAGNIKGCPICNRLNADVAKIGRVQLFDRSTTAPNITSNDEMPHSSIGHAESELFNTGNPLQDLMTRMMFDTKLNQTGQVATALALEDSTLLERVMPTSIDGVVTLMANLTELSQGKGEIYRSPDEVTAYVKALREGVKKPLDGKTGEAKTVTPMVRRASTIIVS